MMNIFWINLQKGGHIVVVMQLSSKFLDTSIGRTELRLFFLLHKIFKTKIYSKEIEINCLENVGWDNNLILYCIATTKINGKQEFSSRKLMVYIILFILQNYFCMESFLNLPYDFLFFFFFFFRQRVILYFMCVCVYFFSHHYLL